MPVPSVMVGNCPRRAGACADGDHAGRKQEVVDAVARGFQRRIIGDAEFLAAPEMDAGLIAKLDR